jgi:hypothetical protein
MRVFILAFLAAITAILLSYNRIPSAPLPNGLQAVVGDSLCRPDGQAWTAAGRIAVVIVTSPTCAACLASRDFASDLAAMASNSGIPIYYVFDATKEKDSSQPRGANTFYTNLASFGIANTPTFIRVDERGMIKSMWTGSVPQDETDRVLDSILNGKSLDAYETITASELDSRLVENGKMAGAQILAFSEIGRRLGASTKRIPPNELDVRAEYELTRDSPVFVDCGSTLSPGDCQQSALVLKKKHFDVVAVGLPKRSASCGSQKL